MSYYDHATMMAHRLGPWADDQERHPSQGERELCQHQNKANTGAISSTPTAFARIWRRWTRPRINPGDCARPL